MQRSNLDAKFQQIDHATTLSRFKRHFCKLEIQSQRESKAWAIDFPICTYESQLVFNGEMSTSRDFQAAVINTVVPQQPTPSSDGNFLTYLCVDS